MYKLWVIDFVENKVYCIYAESDKLVYEVLEKHNINISHVYTMKTSTDVGVTILS